MTLEIVSTNSADTERLGELLGRSLKGSEVIELISDLGGGKTTLVRGMAQGMGSKDHVSSPTFKISNVYKAGKLELHHFDFYRLQEAGILADELTEVIGQSRVVAVIEWGEVVQAALPKNRLSVTITALDEKTRKFMFDYPERLSYLMDDLC